MKPVRAGIFVESVDSNPKALEERHPICRSFGAWDFTGRFYKHVAPLALGKSGGERAAVQKLREICRELANAKRLECG